MEIRHCMEVYAEHRGVQLEVGAGGGSQSLWNTSETIG